MFAVRHLLETMLNPLFIVLFLLAFTLVVFYRKKTERPIFFSFLIIFILLLLMSTGWLPRLVTSALESQYDIVYQPDPKVKWIVVLSGGQSPYLDKPPNMLLYSASLKRLIEGVRLYHALPQAKIVLSGGGFNMDIAEAQRMASVMRLLGIPADKIILETQSINTAAQAKLLKEYVNEAPFYLVTSAAHMPRAFYLCLQEGLKPIAAPTDFTIYWDNEYLRKVYLPSAQNLFYLTVAWHEILGLAWAKAT
ncbi:YdcF family protein [Legionella sp. D16C41]|uniref:YdcF family protein n=1 Tax=Legionella sp. D16C41 TaxID=3402688 RepID=UPI003AF9EEC6